MKLTNHKIALAICLSLGLSACTPEKTAEEYISAAKTHINEDKAADAAIELKNAIRKDLKNGEARYLLGTLYLDEGQAAAAEKEFIRALELGENINLVLPSLLRALNLQSKHEEIIEAIAQARGVSVNNLPIVKLYSAAANIRLGNKDAAYRDISEATDVSADSAFTQLGQALIAAEAQNIDDSLALVEKVIASQPDLIEAYLLKGQLYYAKGAYPEAIRAYQEYFALVPKDLSVRLYLANTYIKNRQFVEADEHIDAILKIAPEHAFSNQLKAIVYYENESYENALSRSEKAIHNRLNSASNRLIAGLSAFKLEKYEVAHSHLITLQNSMPKDHPVQRVLGIVQMHLGYNAKAGETFSSLESVSDSDKDLLVNASYELLKSGDTEGAKSLIDKTESLQSLTADDVAKLGVLKLSLNDLEGITDLENALEMSPELPAAKLALGMAYLSNNNFDAAFKHATDWIAEKPEDTGGYNLAARTLLLQNKVSEAEQYINKSLNVDSNNIYALLYKADQSFSMKDYPASLSFIERVIKASPTNAPALLMNYKANKALGNEAPAKELIASTYQTNTDNLTLRLLYARILFQDKAYAGVIDLLEEVESGDVKKPVYLWHLLSQSYWETKNIAKAETTVNKWAAEHTDSPLPLYRKMHFQEVTANIPNALAINKDAITKFPNDNNLLAYKAHLEILNKDFKGAKQTLASIPREYSDSAFIQGLQGKVLFTEKKYQQAQPLIEEAYKATYSEREAVILYRIYQELKLHEKAYQLLANHYKVSPNDNIVKLALAENALKRDETEFAYTLYSELKLASPNNIAVLNNLAWTEYLLKRYKSAHEHATEALALAPDNAAIKDTLAKIEAEM